MATIIFDFDSTLITRESLEEILAPKLAERPELLEQISEITNLGMEGKITFAESLDRRLKLAAPTRTEVAGFIHQPTGEFTEGMEALCTKLREAGHELRIVSGGLWEAIVPFGAQLGIPSDHVHAVQLTWLEDGSFAGIDPNDGFSFSKIKGVTPLIGDWTAPRIAIGDGMTDYHLFRDGLVDHFIAFTGNVRREAVVATGCPEAADASTLNRLLEQML